MKVRIEFGEEILNSGFEGEGLDLEEAVERAMAVAKEKPNDYSVSVEVAEGWLPLEIAYKIPPAPDGYSIVVFERCSHNDGEAYDWRFVAVVRGSVKFISHPNFGHTVRIKEPIDICSSLDSNSDSEIKLPANSMEYSTDLLEWQPCTELAYFY